MTHLTTTEKQIAKLNILGSGRKMIAQARGTAVGTVQKQLENIHKKTKTSNAQELMIWYLSQYHGIDVKRLLSVFIFLLLLSPSAFLPNSELVRTSSTVRTVKTGRSGRRNDTYYE